MVAAITDGLVACIQFTITQTLGSGLCGAREALIILWPIRSRCGSNKRLQRRFVDAQLAGEHREKPFVSYRHRRSVARNHTSVFVVLPKPDDYFPFW